MGCQKNCWQETGGEGLRIQGALEGYMTAQERIRESTAVVAGVRGTSQRAVWR